MKMQRNMPGAANTTSGSCGAYSNKQRGITPAMGALSQRSSVASAMHNNRGTLAVLLQSNNTQGEPDLPNIVPRVQTTNENKRVSVVELDIGK